MDTELLKNKIIIIKDESKNQLLDLLSSKLINTKIITLNELLKNYFFDYDEKTIYYVSKNYNVCIDVAKRYLNSLYYIDNDYDNKKIHFLYELKKNLMNNNLLIFNKSFVNYLNNKEIVLYELNNIPSLYKNLINKIAINNKITYINDLKLDTNKTIVECNTKEDEISFVASEISKLITNKIDINKIKITNISDDYEFLLKRIFKEFKIPINLNNSYKMTGSKILKEFINNYNNDINITLDIISKLIISSDDEKIYKKIINILNKYSWANNYLDVKDFIIEDLKNITISSIKYDNAIDVIDLKSYIPNDDDYIFLLNFNEGVIPKEFKDEDFLSDNEKEILSQSTSIELNDIENNIVLNKIKSIKNLVITYIMTNGKESLYISSLYDESFMIKKDYNNNFLYSNQFNVNKLVSSLDNYNKYGEVNDVLNKLYSKYYDIPYLSYNHKYKPINKQKLNNKIRLSYSSVDNYFKCSFRYYLKNIIKIDKQEDTFAILIGNIFHHILACCYESDFNFDNMWNNEINNISLPLKNSERYFLKSLKEELKIIIDSLKEQLTYTNLKDVLLEKDITIKIDDNITFIGFVDKIMYKKYDDKTIVSVIDYKTGNPNLNINNIIYGLDMQLPIYVFLIKNSNLFNNVIIGGFYLQKILNNKKTIEEKKNSLKLQGYSNIDEKILQDVDSSYEDSNIIKGLKKGKEKFYSYSKVLDSVQIDKLSDIVKENIIRAGKSILNAEFDINPKEINGELVGCKYCPYKDICFMDNKDIITLEQKELFGGESNELD